MFCSEKTFQLLHYGVNSWSYQQTLGMAGKADKHKNPKIMAVKSFIVQTPARWAPLMEGMHLMVVAFSESEQEILSQRYTISDCLQKDQTEMVSHITMITMIHKSILSAIRN